MKPASLLVLAAQLLLYSLPIKAQLFCNSESGANLIIYSNYEGGYLNINIDQNIPNIKLGICTYEAVAVNVSGPFAGNITEVVFAGFGDINNTGCGPTIPGVSITGVPAGIVTTYTATNNNIALTNYLGNPLDFVNIPLVNCMVSGSGCFEDTNDGGGGNSSPQIVNFFLSEFGPGTTLYYHWTDYSCFPSAVFNVSDGGNCCLQTPASDPNPIFLGGSNYSFLPDDTLLCNGAVTLNLSFYPVLYQPPLYPGYVWSNGVTGPIITITQPGTYSFTVGDYCHAYGSFLTDTITVLPCSCFTASLIIEPEPCGTATATVFTDIAGIYTYNWSGLPAETGAWVSGLAAGDYSVTVANAALSCDTVLNFSIAPPPPFNFVVNNPQPVCLPGLMDLTTPEITAGSEPGLAFLYFTDVSAAQPLANPNAINTPGTYAIMAVNAQGCSQTLPVTVAFNQPIELNGNIAITDTAVCLGEIISVNYAGNSPAFLQAQLVASQPAQTTVSGAQAQVLFGQTGNPQLTFTVTDTNGCQSDTTFLAVVSETTVTTLPDITLLAGQSATLSATTGSLVSYNWQPAEGLSCTNCPQPVASPQQTTTYTVLVTDLAQGCTATAAVTVVVNTPQDTGNIAIPNAFSPNGDGVNDVWRITGNNIQQANVHVYNRWGQPVFETTNVQDGWNGIFNNQNAPAGVYVYWVNGAYTNGQLFEEKGNITLIR